MESSPSLRSGTPFRLVPGRRPALLDGPLDRNSKAGCPIRSADTVEEFIGDVIAGTRHDGVLGPVEEQRITAASPDR